jgi:cytochrome c oxidase cbb3-type subunit 3
MPFACRDRRAGARLAVLLVLLAAPACEREARRFHEPSPASEVPQNVPMTNLQPGKPVPPPEHASSFDPRLAGRYEENAWAIGEGKRYYTWFNCVGCHANGGGGMGPPLMDAEWIYGSEPANIYATIVEGRPNGMPAFRGRIPNQQVWQLVAYVRSMSGLVPLDARPGRNDSLYPRPPEMMLERQPPRPEGTTR